MNDVEATRTFATNKPVKKITIDPKEETADIDTLIKCGQKNS
jgi:hypothetical protein